MSEFLDWFLCGGSVGFGFSGVESLEVGGFFVLRAPLRGDSSRDSALTLGEPVGSHGALSLEYKIQVRS